MSQISWYKSMLRLAKIAAYSSNIEDNPCFQILKQSLDMVVQERRGVEVNYIVDAVGRKTKCDIGISTPEFPRGVGIKVDPKTGMVSFLYDQYGGFGDIARNISEDITQNYVVIAMIRTMKSLGFQVEEERTSKARTVVLVGRI